MPGLAVTSLVHHACTFEAYIVANKWLLHAAVQARLLHAHTYSLRVAAVCMHIVAVWGEESCCVLCYTHALISPGCECQNAHSCKDMVTVAAISCNDP